MFGISACIFLLVVHFYKQPNLRWEFGFLGELSFLRRIVCAAGSKAQKVFAKRDPENLQLKFSFYFPYASS